MKLALLSFALLAAAGCTDPGCIRNTECGSGFRCVEAACVRVAADAGRGDDDSGT